MATSEVSYSVFGRSYRTFANRYPVNLPPHNVHYPPGDPTGFTKCIFK
jgi:hypothetical protein